MIANSGFLRALECTPRPPGWFKGVLLRGKGSGRGEEWEGWEVKGPTPATEPGGAL